MQQQAELIKLLEFLVAADESCVPIDSLPEELLDSDLLTVAQADDLIRLKDWKRHRGYVGDQWVSYESYWRLESVDLPIESAMRSSKQSDSDGPYIEITVAGRESVARTRLEVAGIQLSISDLTKPVQLTAVAGIVHKRSDVIGGKLKRAKCRVIKSGNRCFAEDSDVQKLYPCYRRFREENPVP